VRCQQVLNRPPAVIWLQGREAGAEHGQPDPGDHPGRAEGRPARLDAMPEREPWIAHAAGSRYQRPDAFASSVFLWGARSLPGL
jgi:hypothetical protein